MYMCVHFLLCFASRLLVLAAVRDLTAEKGRMHLCHGSCPRLLLPTATTSAHTRAAALLSCWDWELLASQGLSSPSPGRQQAAAAGTCVPACCWFTVMMLERQQGQQAASHWPSSAGSGHAASCR